MSRLRGRAVRRASRDSTVRDVFVFARCKIPLILPACGHAALYFPLELSAWMFRRYSERRDRRPVILDPNNYESWLDPGMTNLAAASELLKPFDARLMRCYPVSTWINHVVKDDAECSRPVEIAEAQKSAILMTFMTNEERMQRESNLIATIRKKLPDFARMCSAAEKILNVALSPTAERKLHANLNDTIVLMSRNRARKHLARFVDRTAQTETRPVVDILFADAHEARIWGRRSFYAVNISRPYSPFQQQ